MNKENVMDIKLLNRSYLETLSSADLISMADDFGIDIPDNLNRSFIIAELLEVAEELSQKNEDDIVASEDAPVINNTEKLAETFNETSICAILRNPAWIYVYWDISAADLARLSSSSMLTSVLLRVSFWETEDAVNPVESFDIQIGISDRQQYILLSPGRKFVRVDLTAVFSGGQEENLCISKKIRLPFSPQILNKALPGRDVELPPLIELSGMKQLLSSHFENHRQSFL